MSSWKDIEVFYIDGKTMWGMNRFGIEIIYILITLKFFYATDFICAEVFPVLPILFFCTTSAKG
jgi:hypothetical protein